VEEKTETETAPAEKKIESAVPPVSDEESKKKFTKKY
jgi:hypothetical protein